MEELEKIVPSLSDNEYIRDDSLQFWYSDFQVILTSIIVKKNSSYFSAYNQIKYDRGFFHEKNRAILIREGFIVKPMLKSWRFIAEKKRGSF